MATDWRQTVQEAARLQDEAGRLLAEATAQGLESGVEPGEVVETFFQHLARSRDELRDVPEERRPLLTALLMAEGLLGIIKGLLLAQAVKRGT